MGRTVALQVGSIHSVVSAKLNPGHDPLVYRHIGLEPKDAQIVVVKCVVGHMKSYAGIMKKTIWTDCPGATPSNLTRLKHRLVPRPLFPLDRAGVLNCPSRLPMEPTLTIFPPPALRPNVPSARG